MPIWDQGLPDVISPTCNPLVAQVLQSYIDSGYLDQFVPMQGGLLYRGYPYNSDVVRGSILNRNLFFNPDQIPPPEQGCTGIQAIPVSATAGALQIGGLAASAAGSAAGIATAVGAIGGALSIGLAAVTAGVGLIVGPLIAAIEQKAKNISNFQQMLCTVGLTLAQAIPQIDDAVANGTISATDAANGLISLCQKCNQLLANVTTKAEEGASAIYRPGVLAHWDIAVKLYNDVAALRNSAATETSPSAGAPSAENLGLTTNAASPIAAPGTAAAVSARISISPMLLLLLLGLAAAFFL